MTRTLVIDTATAACSVALIENGAVIAHAHDLVGRGHAEQLVPMIAALPDGGRADSILVDCGPGSFTGVRVGIAAARGLALGWGVPVTGYTSTAIVAAAAIARTDHPAVAVVLEGGHGEVFVQVYDRAMVTREALVSLTPAAAMEAIQGLTAFGNGVHRLAALGRVDVIEALPDAGDAPLLPLHAGALPARPIYGRAPDAKLPVVPVQAGSR